LLGKVHFLRATFGKSCRYPDTENPAYAGFLLDGFRPRLCKRDCKSDCVIAYH